MRLFKSIVLTIWTFAFLVGAVWFIAGSSSEGDKQAEPTGVADRQPAITLSDAPRVDGPAFKGCRLRTTAAAVCSSGRAAVLAEQLYASDPHKMDQSYSRQVLAESGCFVIKRDGPPIQRLSHAKVAFSDGWVGVTMVVVGSGNGVIADAYLEGVCERYVPVTTVLQQDAVQPDYGATDVPKGSEEQREPE